MLKGQVDVSAAIIKGMERLRLAHDVRWPNPARLAAKLQDPALRHRIRGWHPDLPATGARQAAAPASRDDSAVV